VQQAKGKRKREDNRDDMCEGGGGEKCVYGGSFWWLEKGARGYSERGCPAGPTMNTTVIHHNGWKRSKSINTSGLG